MREHVLALLDDQRLRDLGLNHAYMNNAVPSDAPLPFVVVRWNTVDRGVGPVKVQHVSIWFYDEPMDYSRIDNFAKTLRVIADGVAGTHNGSDEYLMSMDWEGDSQDVFADEYGAICRYCTYKVVGRGF